MMELVGFQEIFTIVKRGKDPGPDSITNTMLKYGGNRMVVRCVPMIWKERVS